jgi:hypothetical protein
VSGDPQTMESLIRETLATHVQSARNRRCVCGWRPSWPDDRLGAEYIQFRDHLTEELATNIKKTIMAKTTMHEYKSDPQSGAGNCVCGQAERHRDHFHKFVKAMSSDTCTCALPESASCHMDMVWVGDSHVVRRSILDTMKVMNDD